LIVDERQRAVADAREVPLLRFQNALGFPAALFAVLCGALIFLLLHLPRMLAPEGAGASQSTGTALFFATTFGILAAFTRSVYYGGVTDLRALRPIIPLAPEDLECIARGLTRATRAQVLAASAIGLGIGLGHALILGQYELPAARLIPQLTATVGLWILMFATLAKLIINARIFSRLGSIAEPDLLRPSRQAPFGTAALRPALFLIGILCAYPLLAISNDDPLGRGAWIGAAACIATLIGIVALPLTGIRARIRERRREILKALDERLEAMGSRDLHAVSAEQLRDMDTILDMRERVAQAPSWPLDLAGVRRILLYIVLPPLTWAAAALVERLVDSVV